MAHRKQFKQVHDVPPHLLTAYNNLRRSELVTKRDTNPVPSKEAMKAFAMILNDTVPKNDFVKGERTMVLKLVYITKETDAMMNLINDNRHDLKPYILWTSGPKIAAHFGIDKYVTIWFDKKNNVYSVREFGAAREFRATAPRQRYAQKYPPQNNGAKNNPELLDEDEEELDEKSATVDTFPINRNEFAKLIAQVQAEKNANAARSAAEDISAELDELVDAAPADDGADATEQTADSTEQTADA